MSDRQLGEERARPIINRPLAAFSAFLSAELTSVSSILDASSWSEKSIPREIEEEFAGSSQLVGSQTIRLRGFLVSAQSMRIVPITPIMLGIFLQRSTPSVKHLLPPASMTR